MSEVANSVSTDCLTLWYSLEHVPAPIRVIVNVNQIAFNFTLGKVEHVYVVNVTSRGYWYDATGSTLSYGMYCKRSFSLAPQLRFEP